MNDFIVFANYECIELQKQIICPIISNTDFYFYFLQNNVSGSKKRELNDYDSLV